jgi:aryl-phospho-beta-D-glucosidase BglC (GH1 family)
VSGSGHQTIACNAACDLAYTTTLDSSQLSSCLNSGSAPDPDTNAACRSAVGQSNDNHWWGGNFEGVRAREVQLSINERLVHAPHVYGPSVYEQAYFSAANYPNNLPAIWERHWGFAAALTGTPAVITEWGGWYVASSSDIPAGQPWNGGTPGTWGQTGASDIAFQELLMSHIVNNQIGFFYWCAKPGSPPVPVSL